MTRTYTTMHRRPVRRWWLLGSTVAKLRRMGVDHTIDAPLFGESILDAIRENA